MSHVNQWKGWEYREGVLDLNEPAYFVKKLKDGNQIIAMKGMFYPVNKNGKCLKEALTYKDALKIIEKSSEDLKPSIHFLSQ